MKDKKHIKKIGWDILIVVSFFLIVFILCYSGYYKKKQNSMVLKTQYTFSVCIDRQGNVIKDDESIEDNDKTELNVEFGDVSIEQIANIWIAEFTNQFKQNYISNLKAINDVEILKVQVISAAENNVLISFSFEPTSGVFDYFASWDGYRKENRLVCEWVVQFEIEDLYNNTARIFASSVQLPEDYGLTTSKSTSTDSDTEAIASLSKSTSASNLYTYDIKNDKLMVTFDGKEKWNTVPIDINVLFPASSDKTALTQGSYQVELEKTAFLFGGNTVMGKVVPLTILYSDDKAENWTSATVCDITDVSFYYVNFIDDKDGFIVIGYNKTDIKEDSMILRTFDGGESWVEVKSGPLTNIIRGVNIIDDKIGFIGYEYTSGMESNLYFTIDGGKSFSPVILGSQQFADANTKLTWNLVYKDIQVPTLNEEGILILFVTQGSSGDYNGGDTVAKYQSNDNGLTWKYIGEE